MRVRLETSGADGGPAASADVDLVAGGRLVQILVGQQPLLRPAHTDERRSIEWGCYPMAPWVGRLGRGCFEFEGTLHRIAPNLGDHAIHGLVFDRTWDVDEQDPSTLVASCALRWPLGGRVVHRIALQPGRLTCELTVEPTTGPLVAEVGWHPWFLRPDELDFSPLAMYERGPDQLPTGRTVRPTPPPWDDCFLATGPVILRYDRADAPSVAVESDCDHWMIFDEPADATCVEPQSGPPNAFNLRPRRLDPGEQLTRTMTIRW